MVSGGTSLVSSCIGVAGRECVDCPDLASIVLDPSPCTPTLVGQGHYNARDPSTGQCSFSASERCDAGTPYQVVCGCPQATCACLGPTQNVIPFADCEICQGSGPPAPSMSMLVDLFAQCGFPN
jgi:hypothetical protein